MTATIGGGDAGEDVAAVEASAVWDGHVRGEGAGLGWEKGARRTAGHQSGGGTQLLPCMHPSRPPVLHISSFPQSHWPPLPPLYPLQGHGTHVSSTCVGASYGVAKRATLHAVRRGRGSCPEAQEGCTGGGRTWQRALVPHKLPLPSPASHTPLLPTPRLRR